MTRFIFALFAIIFPLAASAATMTFDKGAGVYDDFDDDGFARRYTENGIAVTGFTIDGLTYESERAHLDNFGGPFTNRLTFTYGGWFDLTSFELWPISLGLCGENPVPCAYDHVVLTGYRGSTAVAQQQFPMGNAPSLRLGTAAFSSLTSLQIYAPPPPYEDASPDIHFEIDNLVLARGVPAPVPLPASLPLLATGLGALVLIRRRRAARQWSSPNPG
jgi:hypothetical protein